MTIYEYILIAVLLIIGASLVVIGKKKQIFNKEFVLISVCLLSMPIVIYSILTVGQAEIHSDTATASLLIDSCIRNKSIFPASWNYANGEIWVLSSSTFTFIPHVLLADKTLARAIGSALFVSAAMLSLFFFSKKLFKDNSWSVIIPIIFLIIWGEKDMTLYQVAYVGPLVFTSLWLYWAYKCISAENIKSSLKYYIPLFCMTLIFTLSGFRGLLETTIVYTLFILCKYYKKFDNSDEKKREEAEKLLLSKLGLVLIPSIIGLVFYRIISNAHIMNADADPSGMFFVRNIYEIPNNIIVSITNFYSVFGFTDGVSVLSIYGIQTLISLVACTLICFVIPVLQYRKLNEESEEVKFIFWFGMLHNVIMFLTVILLTDKTNPRYLLTSVYFLVYISGRYIYKYWIKSKNLISSLFIVAFIFTLFVNVECLLNYGRDWKERVDNLKTFSNQLIEFGMEKGYGTYGNTYIMEIFSDGNLRMGGVHFLETSEDEIFIKRWLVDNSAFEPQDCKSFFLADLYERDTYEDLILGTFGEPVETIEYGRYYAYIYDYDIVINMAEYTEGVN